MHLPKKKVLNNVLLVACSLLMGFLILEVGFRAYTYSLNPSKFVSPLELPQSFGANDRSLWKFHPRHGYYYPPGIKVNNISITKGKLVGCGLATYVNEDGNIGKKLDNHENPDFTVAIFGDSWTAFYVDGMTWPTFLKEQLETRTGKKVNVHNFGRDGTGIIHMFRMAEEKLPVIQPDLAIVAFITDDLDRAMYWRTETRINGELRVLTTVDPRENPDIQKSVDTTLVHEAATEDWCQSTVGKRDKVVQELEKKYRKLLLHANTEAGPPPDIFTFQHSFVLNFIIHKNAIHFAKRKYRISQNPRLIEADFAQVEGFKDTVLNVQKTEVPLKLVHLSIYPELKKNMEYELTLTRKSLLRSLERLLGHKAFETILNSELPEPLESINFAEDNYHPSVVGMQFYANVVSNIIRDNNLLH